VFAAAGRSAVGYVSSGCVCDTGCVLIDTNKGLLVFLFWGHHTTAETPKARVVAGPTVQAASRALPRAGACDHTAREVPVHVLRPWRLLLDPLRWPLGPAGVCRMAQECCHTMYVVVGKVC